MREPGPEVLCLSRLRPHTPREGLWAQDLSPAETARVKTASENCAAFFFFFEHLTALLSSTEERAGSFAWEKSLQFK